MDTHKHLLAHGIKLSLQRIAIMEYLLEHTTHPTVDEIYTKLFPVMPTLSKTTIYNTLKLLSEQGAIQMITIDEKNVRFDA
ncbi:Peroxide-responsive repressor PerR, partial [termite gut metagenome]